VGFHGTVHTAVVAARADQRPAAGASAAACGCSFLGRTEQADAASVTQDACRRADVRSRDAARPCLSRGRQSERGLPACGTRSRERARVDAVRADVRVPKERPHRCRRGVLHATPSERTPVEASAVTCGRADRVGRPVSRQLRSRPSQGTHARRAQARSPRGAGGPHAFVSPSHSRSTACRPAEQSRDRMPDALRPRGLNRRTMV